MYISFSKKFNSIDCYYYFKNYILKLFIYSVHSYLYNIKFIISLQNLFVLKYVYNLNRKCIII